MNRIYAFLPMLALGVAVAQNPVPSLTKTEIYGAASGFPDPLAVALGIDAASEQGSMLRFTGGLQGGIAVLAFGMAPTAVIMPQGTMLLVDPLFTVPGFFDSQGLFVLPIDILNQGFVGYTVYVQGLHWVPPPLHSVEYFQMTPGLRVTFVKGNEQPDLQYDGPPLTATLIAKRDLDHPMTYEAYATVLAPTGGYDLRLQAVENLQGITQVYASLEAPNPKEIFSPLPETKRLSVDLGNNVESSINLLIEQRVRGLPNPPAFTLAATLVRDF